MSRAPVSVPGRRRVGLIYCEGTVSPVVLRRRLLQVGGELAATGAEDAAWDALEARSATCSVGQERIEVVEARALAALRRGRRADAAHDLARAVELSTRIPNMMRGRLQRWLAEARAPG